MEFWRTTRRGLAWRAFGRDAGAASSIRLREFAESWFKQEEKGWKLKTAAGYRSILDHHILPAPEDRPIGSLKTRDTKTFRSGLNGTIGTKRNILRARKRSASIWGTPESPDHIYHSVPTASERRERLNLSYGRKTEGSHAGRVRR